MLVQGLTSIQPPILMTKKTDFSRELQRKALHLVALVIPWGMLQVAKPYALIVLGAAAAAALTLDFLRSRFPGLAVWVHRLFGAFMRPEERSLSTGRLIVNGSTWTLIAAFLLLLIFPARIASLALVISLLGDAASGLVGQRYGKTSWGISNCTVEGSAAFIAIALVIVWLLPGVQPWIGIAGALCACAAEIFPGPFNDNLRVPVVAAGVMYILECMLLGN